MARWLSDSCSRGFPSTAKKDGAPRFVHSFPRRRRLSFAPRCIFTRAEADSSLAGRGHTKFPRRSSLHLWPARGCDARETSTTGVYLRLRAEFCRLAVCLPPRPPVRRALSKRSRCYRGRAAPPFMRPPFPRRREATRCGALHRESVTLAACTHVPGVCVRVDQMAATHWLRNGELAFFFFSLFLSFLGPLSRDPFSRKDAVASRYLADVFSRRGLARLETDPGFLDPAGYTTTRVGRTWSVATSSRIPWRIKSALRRFVLCLLTSLGSLSFGFQIVWITRVDFSPIREIERGPPAGSAVPDRNGDCKGPARSAGSAQNEYEADRFRSRDPFQSSRVAPFERLFAGWFCRRMLRAAHVTDARWLWPWRASQRETPEGNPKEKSQRRVMSVVAAISRVLAVAVQAT